MGGVVGHGGGKLLLFGEHAAVYGHVAVGVSLPEGISVRLEGAETPDWDLDRVTEEDRGVVTRVLQRMEPRLRRAAPRRAVRIESSIPRGLGFGSSAALCVACARALLEDSGEDREATDRIWDLAHDAEHLFHGTPSGVDTGISLLGGTCVLRPRKLGLPVPSLIPARGVALVAGAVRRDESCAALIAGLAARMKSGDHVVGSAIEELGEMSGHGARALLSGGNELAAYLGSLADAAMATLHELGLSTSDLDFVLAAARRAGAMGGKLSGGGGGGAFYAVAPDKQTATIIATRITEEARLTGIDLVVAPRVVTI